MTHEEALELLQARKEHYEMGEHSQELAKALELAICSLNREKSTIDILEQVKTKISKLTTCELGSWQEITAGEMRNDAINEVDKFICKLKGEWI